MGSTLESGARDVGARGGARGRPIGGAWVLGTVESMKLLGVMEPMMVLGTVELVVVLAWDGGAHDGARDIGARGGACLGRWNP